jgi:hypothetical protein
MLPTPATHQTNDFDLRKIQENVGAAFRQLAKSVPWLDGALVDSEVDSTGHTVDGVAFTAATAKDVAHRLGRKPRGFIVVDNFGTNASNLLRTDGSTDAKTLRLTSTVTCRVKLWVW